LPIYSGTQTIIQVCTGDEHIAIYLMRYKCAVIAYTFFGLDALSEELEEPFGFASNQLPLMALSRTIEINLLEAMGETDLPPEIAPINSYLQ